MIKLLDMNKTFYKSFASDEKYIPLEASVLGK
jgi:hypothetical protein